MQYMQREYAGWPPKWAEVGSGQRFHDMMELMRYHRSKCVSFGRQDRYFIPIMMMSLTLVLLTGCASDSESIALAPSPPKFDPNAPREEITEIALETAIGAGQGLGTHGVRDASLTEGVKTAMRQDVIPKRCRIQDRFDRKALIAYEWGGRSRLGLDIDGLSYDNYEIEKVKVEYRLRFSAYKTSKERCRYASKWQGILGTGYNELFLREKDTIWEEINVLENDLEDGFDAVFH